MNKLRSHIAKKLLLPVALLTTAICSAQSDSTRPFISGDSLLKASPPATISSRLDSAIRLQSPRKAAIRSALVPGLGQIYNRKYWKLPIIYGALGATGAIFSYNLKNYKDLRFAYKAKFQAASNPPDSTLYARIRTDLKLFDINTLRSLRDEFRRNIDYSAVVFVLLWGLNVVDATVDAHLKAFDVSPDLSFRVNFGHSEMAGTNGVSLVLAFK